MPPKELELLYFLASSPNQGFTREQLLDHIWGYEYIGIPLPLTFISSVFVKRSRIIRSGVLQLSGESVTNLRSKQMKKTIDLHVFCYLILLGISQVFFLVTFAGSHLLEARLEKSISSDICQDWPSLQKVILSVITSLLPNGIYPQTICLAANYPDTIIWIINSNGQIILSTTQGYLIRIIPLIWMVLILLPGAATIIRLGFLRILS